MQLEMNNEIAASVLCAFCGEPMNSAEERDRTREHAFPRWLDEFIPGIQDDKTFTATVNSGETGEVLRSWKSQKLNFRAKRVCGDCNNGWMSRLETAAKPALASILNGHRREYFRGGQNVMAGWAIKTALALELVNRDDYPPIPPQHFRDITETEGKPGGRTQVFFGAFKYRNRLGHQVRRLMLNEGEDDESSAYLSTFHVGCVLFQVFFHDHPEHIELERASGTDQWVTQIWPYQGPAKWPAKRVADEDALLQLKEGMSPMRERFLAGPF